MRRSAAIAVLILVPLGACGRGSSAIEARSVRGKNPTTWDFALSKEALHSAAMKAFSMAQQFKAPIFGSSADPTILHVSDAAAPVFGTDLLSTPGNEFDLYLQNFHEPLWQSPIYYGPTGAFAFLAEFHLHLSTLDEGRTRVSVKTRRSEVINGESLGFGHSGPGWFTRYVPVDSTTIEEFMLLRYLGRLLGTQGMPEVILPERPAR